MCKIVRQLSLFALLSLVFASAVGLPLNQSQRDTLLAQISAVRPDLQFEIIGPAPVAELYEVQVINGPVLYVSADGEYFFDGSLFRVEEGGFVDIAAKRLNAQRKKMLDAVDPQTMIIYTPQTQRRATITVFTDIDCGY